MSKLKCNCGHVIADQANNLSFRADYLPDRSSEDFSHDIIEIIKSFNQAKDSGQKENWINENFTVPPYPTDLPDHEMVWDLIHNSFIEKTRTIYQCESCGRIWIQRGLTDNFISFKPETKDWQGILNK
jgi:hypothetical protein